HQTSLFLFLQEFLENKPSIIASSFSGRLATEFRFERRTLLRIIILASQNANKLERMSSVALDEDRASLLCFRMRKNNKNGITVIMSLN
ncbi:MAG TPA: hypothetical protein VIP56_08025, partial [Nitrososphaeraceae archaeon]